MYQKVKKSIVLFGLFISIALPSVAHAGGSYGLNLKETAMEREQVVIISTCRDVASGRSLTL
jgi:hypothetical protein